MKTLELTAEERPSNILVIHAKGVFDISQIGKFDEFLAKEKKNHANIGINFEEVSFVDSSGIGALIRLLNALKQKKGLLYVYSLNEYIDKVFKNSKMDIFLKIMTKADFDKNFPANNDTSDLMRRL